MSAAELAVSGSWLSALYDLIGGSADALEKGRVDEVAGALAVLAQRVDCPQADALTSPELPFRRLRLAAAEGSSHSCLLIAWSPDAATPLHDHAGLWGMELVLDGALQVEEFAAMDVLPHGGLVCRRKQLLGLGDTVAFSDADYLHRCRNLSNRQSALSLHLYGGTLHRYQVFEPDQTNWTSRSVTASIDAVMR